MARSKKKFEDIVIRDPEDAERRLNTLGFSANLLTECIRRGQLAGDFITVSRPRTARGFTVWSETNGELRDELALLNWSFNDDDNIPRAISSDGEVIVTAMSGNERTGLREGEHAQTKRKRGLACFRIVRINAQLEFQEVLPSEQQGEAEERAVSSLGQTWFLLYHRVGDIVRSELSLARAVTSDGRLLQWSERIPLPDVDLNTLPPITKNDGGDGPEIVVPVERRVG